MKTEVLPEIIEIIDDGVDPFGFQAPNPTIQDPGGSRWIGPAAAAVLVALIGYGVATSASESGVPTVAPVPSTTPTTASPPTSAPAPMTTVPRQLVPYYAAEPPRDLTVLDAHYEEMDRGYSGAGDYQLWAMPHSTASSGVWFSIQSLRTGPRPIALSDAYRVQSEERSMAISHATSGLSIAQFLIDDLMTVTLTSFGLSDEDLIRLATSITMDEGSTEGDVVHVFRPVADLFAYQMMSSVPPWLAVQGEPVEQVHYAPTNDPLGGFTITVAPRTSDRAGSTLDRQIALRFLLDHATPFSVDGHSAVAGYVINQPELSLATWIAGDHIVTAYATMPLSELIAIARTVHETSSDEWRGMLFQAYGRGTNLDDDVAPTVAVPVSFGVDAEGEEWVIKAGVSTYSSQKAVDWQWTTMGTRILNDGAATIDTIVDGTRTYVLAELPRGIVPTPRLQITRSGLEPVLVSFVDIDPNFDRIVAAYAFSEPGQYTAQIIGEDGAVLANWPAG